MNALRDIAEEHGTRGYVFDGSQSWALIDTQDCEDVPGFQIWMTWYKSRGRTEGCYLMSDDRPPEPLKLQDAEQIIAVAP